MHDIEQSAFAHKAEDRAADTASAPQAPQSWRDSITVHPAAELFPLMKETDPVGLAELAADIKKNGIISPIALWQADEDAPVQLLDGRNRLDALELALGRPQRIAKRGRAFWKLEADEPTSVDDLQVRQAKSIAVVLDHDTDPYAYVAAANLHRRHLTAAQKRELIAELIKAQPEKSNRQIAQTAQVDDKTVGGVRRGLESTAEIPQLEQTLGADGKKRRRPTSRKAKKPAATAGSKSNGNGAATDPAATTPTGGEELGDEIAHKERIRELEHEIERLKDAHASEIGDLKANAAKPAAAAERDGTAPTAIIEPDAMTAIIDEHRRSWALADLAKLSMGDLLRLLPDKTKAALKHRVIEHLTLEELLDALERRLPGAPPTAAVNGAFKALKKVLLP
jgi:hypothetical protein